MTGAADHIRQALLDAMREVGLHDAIVDTVARRGIADDQEAITELVTYALRAARNAVDWTPTHEQVPLDELGFSVDAGLEDLIRVCWRRGIATDLSCIGTADHHGGDGWIGFYSPIAAQRWEELTGVDCDWNDDDEVATVAEAYFRADGIPTIVARLTGAP